MAGRARGCTAARGGDPARSSRIEVTRDTFASGRQPYSFEFAYPLARSRAPMCSRPAAGLGAGMLRLCGREPLGAPLDPIEHLPLHHERTSLHRQHADPRGERRQPEAVAADQPRPAVLLLEQERPNPVAILRAPGKYMFWLDPLKPHPVWAKADRVADLRMLELRENVIDAVHISVSYTHLRAHETVLDLVCRLLL